MADLGEASLLLDTCPPVKSENEDLLLDIELSIADIAFPAIPLTKDF